MVATRQGSIDAPPAQQLGAPGDVSVFAVNEKVGIEKLAVDRNVIDHLTAVQCGGGRGSEHVLKIRVMAVVHLLAAPVQVPQHGCEVDAGGIDELLFGKVERSLNGQEFAAYRADFLVELACRHQL